MEKMWDTIPYVTSASALVAFLAGTMGLIARAYINRFKDILLTLPKGDRALRVDRYLARRGVDIETIPDAKRLEYARKLLENQAKEFLISATVIVLLALTVGAVAIVALVSLPYKQSTVDEGNTTPQFSDEDVISPGSNLNWRVPDGVSLCTIKGVGGGGGGGSNGYSGGRGGDTSFIYDGLPSETICKGAFEGSLSEPGSGPDQYAGGAGGRADRHVTAGADSPAHQGGAVVYNPGYNNERYLGGGGGASSYAPGGNGGSFGGRKGGAGGTGAGGGGGYGVGDNVWGGGGGAGCQEQSLTLRVKEGKIISFTLGAGGQGALGQAGNNGGGDGGPGEVRIYFSKPSASPIMEWFVRTLLCAVPISSLGSVLAGAAHFLRKRNLRTSAKARKSVTKSVTKKLK